MHNKVIVLHLANVVFTTLKFLHGDYKAIVTDWVHKSGKPGPTQPHWNAQTPIKPKHVRNDCTICWTPRIAPSPCLFSMTWRRHTWKLVTVLPSRITKENSCFPQLTKYKSQTCHGWPFILFWQPGKYKVISRHRVREELRLEDHPVQPLPKQGQPEQVAQDGVQLGFGYLQRWRLHNLFGQPAPVFDTLTVKTVFLYVEVECPVLQSLILSGLQIQSL